MQQYNYLDMHHSTAPFDRDGRAKNPTSRHRFELRSRSAALRALRRRERFSRWVYTFICLIKKRLQGQAN